MSVVARHKFQTLDAMRGVAAVCVMLFHFKARLPGVGGASLFGSGNLAVDLFFVLSGFVIAFAYDDRLADGLPIGRFVIFRAIRLLPMIALGASLGGALLLVTTEHSASDILLASAVNAIGLPVPAWPMFPTNDAEWSLFCEIVVNLVFVAAFPFLDRRALTAIVGACGLALVPLTIRHGHVYHASGLGFLLSDFLRVGYSFFLGVSLSRTRHLWQPRLPRLPSWAILGLTAIFLFAPASGVFQTVYDLFGIGIVSPLLVMLGSVAMPPVGARRFAAISAAISYPLYAIHIPVHHWLTMLCDRYAWPVEPASTLAVVTLLPVSYALARYYDAPLRSGLSGLDRVLVRRLGEQPG